MTAAVSSKEKSALRFSLSSGFIELKGKPIALKAWKQEYAQLKTEYAELSPQHKPLREEVIRLRQVQNAVDTALRRREQPQAVQRKKHEMEL